MKIILQKRFLQYFFSFQVFLLKRFLLKNFHVYNFIEEKVFLLIYFLFKSFVVKKPFILNFLVKKYFTISFFFTQFSFKKFTRLLTKVCREEAWTFVCCETSSCLRVDHINWIIRPQAFSTLRPVLSQKKKNETGLSLLKACGLMIELVRSSFCLKNFIFKVLY